MDSFLGPGQIITFCTFRKNELLLLGGKSLIRRNAPVEEYTNCKQNLCIYNIEDKQWSTMDVDSEAQFHLQRSQFGCSMMYPLVFITGGLRRGLNKEFEAMDISELIILNLQTKKVRKTKLKGLETLPKLFAVSLTQRPTTTRTELLLFGGSSLDRDALSSDQYKKSESYYWIYPD